MVWLVFALLSAISDSIKALIHRKVMITEDPYTYALFENIFAAIIFLIFVNKFTFPKDLYPWFIVLLASIIWFAISIISQYSYKYTKVSIQEPIKQTRIVWVFLFGLFFLHELITVQKIFGTILILIGLIILSYQKKKKLGNLTDKGVQFTLLTAFLFASVTVVDKHALTYFNAETYGFLVYLIPGLILLIINRKGKEEAISSLIKKYWWAIIVISVTSFGYYYFKLKALELADASLVFPIVRSGSILTVLGGIIFLKEKEHIAKKIISSVIVFVGVLMLSL